MLLVGYGTENGVDYWKVRWSKSGGVEADLGVFFSGFDTYQFTFKKK